MTGQLDLKANRMKQRQIRCDETTNGEACLREKPRGKGFMPQRLRGGAWRATKTRRRGSIEDMLLFGIDFGG